MLFYHDEYAKYRPALTREQETLLESALSVGEKRKLYEEFALHEAREQLRSAEDLPEDESVCIRFPGVDPRGKFSIIDMKLAQRRETIRATLCARSPEVRAGVEALLDSSAFQELDAALTRVAREHRMDTRAAKLCHDASAAAALLLHAKSLKAGSEAAMADTALQGIEYLLGIRSGAVPEDVRNVYASVLGYALTPERMVAGRSVFRPESLPIEYPDLSAQLAQMQSSNPKNMSGQIPPEAELSASEIETHIRAYSRAVAMRALNVFYDASESMTSVSEKPVDRGDCLMIDGVTAREILRKRNPFGDSEDASAFETRYAREGHLLTAELLTGALMTGKRVEAFLPDALGRLPDTPTRVVKSGFAPEKQLSKAVLALWDGFWARQGFARSEPREKSAEASASRKPPRGGTAINR